MRAGGEGDAPAALPPVNRVGIHYTRDCAGSTGGLNGSENQKIS